jgi:hypothetical protein
MHAYRQDEYDQAWDEARRFNTPGLYLDPLIRVAALGQLDRRPEAEKSVGEMLELMSDFTTHGPQVIRRMVFVEENVALLLEGLRKAGLETGGEMSNVTCELSGSFSQCAI